MNLPSAFQNMILNKKDVLMKLDFKVNVDDEKYYRFIIHNIWKDSLNIVIFIRYDSIFHYTKTYKSRFSNPIEYSLKKIISPDVESVFDLKMDTKAKKPQLFKESIFVKINEVNYKFKISGAGNEAIKISYKMNFLDIYLAEQPLEKILKNIIYFIHTNLERSWDMSMYEMKNLLG